MAVFDQDEASKTRVLWSTYTLQHSFENNFNPKIEFMHIL